MHQLSTETDADTVTRFRRNPVGFVVELRDGTEHEVRDFSDSTDGRWYKFVGYGRKWIPEWEVVGLVVFTLSLPVEEIERWKLGKRVGR